MKGMGAAALATVAMAVSCCCGALGFVAPAAGGGSLVIAAERTRSAGTWGDEMFVVFYSNRHTVMLVKLVNHVV